MTWTWTLTKFGIGWGLGVISSNPIGWAVGISTSQYIKSEGYKNLNSSTQTLSIKEDAERWIELAEDHQLGAGLGIIGKGLGSIVSRMANETLSIGRQASKEIAIHGFKTELAKELIKNGQFISTIEKNIRIVNTIKKLWEKVNEFKNLVNDLSTSDNDEEFIININNLIQVQNLLIDKLELLNLSDKKLLNSIRDTILELNRKNVKIYIDNQKNKEDHRNINREINKLLKRVKKLQQKLHNQKNCCEKCRFC